MPEVPVKESQMSHRLKMACSDLIVPFPLATALIRLSVIMPEGKTSTGKQGSPRVLFHGVEGIDFIFTATSPTLTNPLKADGGEVPSTVARARIKRYFTLIEDSFVSLLL